MSLSIVFMGTPDFSVPCLRALAESQHTVTAVFTQPDKPKGRGYKMIPTPVKQAAQEYDIPVYQPQSLRKGEDAQQAMQVLEQLHPDVIVVVAYGQILPKCVLDLPRYACINVHASLLPAYRGAAPIHWCILNGESKTGVTTMLMAEGLDTGDMLLKAETAIDPDETTGQLHDRLSEMGANLLLETLQELEAGTLHPQPQDDAASCYATRITKEQSALDFSKSAAQLHNVIRGITGYTMLDGKRLKVYASKVIKDGAWQEAAPGTIVDPKALVVACGADTYLQLLEVQPEGKKRMQVADFLRGKQLAAGTVLG